MFLMSFRRFWAQTTVFDCLAWDLLLDLRMREIIHIRAIPSVDDEIGLLSFDR